MQTCTLRRHKQAEFVFEGEHLVTVDDREWLGVTPNWWELSLYRTANGTFVLGSVYYQNCPRGATVYGALEMDNMDAAATWLLRHCGAPEMIIEALLHRARRNARHKDMPPAPLQLRAPERSFFGMGLMPAPA